jgi:hypothetical protein
MKNSPISILIYGREAHLLETRKWVLQSRGYRVVTIPDLAGIDLLPLAPPFALLILCHSLPAKEAQAATALAARRWPGIKDLVMTVDKSRSPTGLLGQLLHTMGGPTNLLSQVGALVGHTASSPNPTSIEEPQSTG